MSPSPFIKIELGGHYPLHGLHGAWFLFSSFPGPATAKLDELSILVFFSAQVMILITGAHKAFALYKAIEEGVNHMWTVSAFQQHPRTIFVCDEDATLELRVKTVKYFKGTNNQYLLIHNVNSCWEYSKFNKVP